MPLFRLRHEGVDLCYLYPVEHFLDGFLHLRPRGLGMHKHHIFAVFQLPHGFFRYQRAEKHVVILQISH
jgi:hypothetical protein